MFSIVYVFSLLCIVKSAKILVVVPVPSVSHQVVFRPLIQALIGRNHELTVITTDPMYPQDKSPKNLSEIDVHDLSYTLWNKMLSETKKDESSMLSEMTAIFRVASIIFRAQLKNKSVQKLITDKTVQFDVLILEACFIPALIYSHIFKAPVIQMSSFGAIPGNMETIGAVTHPILYPTHYHQRIYNLTILEKITEIYNDVAFKRMVEKQEDTDNEMLQDLFGIDTPLLSQLKNNVHMLFLNVHPIWVHNQPVPPNVIFIWGMHQKLKKELPNELQNYLDSSKNGVIYVSFGSNIKTSFIDAEKLQILLRVFSQLPYDILWKYDMDDLPGKSDNIKLSRWLPQYDVLRHPNLKLFITQGGLQSTDEALDAGVPLIGIPIYADQEYNVEKYVHFKIGKKLDISSLNAEDLNMTIMNIFANYESYEKNIINLRTKLLDQPKPSLENAVWWVEYVLRHGGARHLRTPAANMSWTEYYELELVFIILGGLTIAVTVLILLAYLCFQYTSNTIQKLCNTQSFLATQLKSVELLKDKKLQ